jgi:hypothetical protein
MQHKCMNQRQYSWQGPGLVTSRCYPAVDVMVTTCQDDCRVMQAYCQTPLDKSWVCHEHQLHRTCSCCTCCRCTRPGCEYTPLCTALY